MKFICPLCRGNIDGEDDWVGMQADCPYCGKEITIPAPEVIKLPPVPPPRGREPVKAAPPAITDAGQRSVGPAPNIVDAVAAKCGELASKGFAAINRGLDEVGRCLAIPSRYKPKWIIVGAVSLLVAILAAIAIIEARPEKRRDNTADYLSRMISDLSQQPGAPSLQESRERMNSQTGKPCMACSGTGISGNSGVNCNSCFGRGTITTPSGYDTVCSLCGGSGRVRQRCSFCDGTGRHR